MILPNQFRTGNLVLHPLCKTPVKIVLLDALKNHVVTEVGGCSSLDIELVPLTEEWLVKLGFEKESNCFVKDIAIYGKEGNYTYNASFFEHDNLIEINYVHQLQNLYFALTGEELTIK